MPVIPTLDDLQALNSEVNVIPYVPGMGPTEPVDYWTYKPEAGKSWVCRDFVEDKADQLRQRGVDPLTLTILLLWTEPVLPPPNEREYHAILCVQLEGQNWLLDSRFTDIYQMDDPPVDYRYDRQQIPGTVDFRDLSQTGLA
jgi:predicted transglutaminase-like cysteine proteinase